MMKKALFVIVSLTVAAAVILLAGCRKKNPPSTDDIDGGVRTNRTDPDAPKSITSTEITSFNCVFSTATLDEAYGFEGRVYTLEAEVKNGRTYGKFDFYNRSGEGNKLSFDADVQFMDSLYGIIAKYDFAKHNGYSYFISGLPDMYGAELDITFASGESIYASDNQSNFLGVEAMQELVSLFKEYSGIEDPTDDSVWQSMNIYRTHSVWSLCFNMSVTAEQDGSMVLSGFCIGDDGKEYSSEEGVLVSEEGVSALRELELDSLPDFKKKPDLGFQVMDETVQKLKLVYADGKTAEKELTDETLDEVFEILLSEFRAH